MTNCRIVYKNLWRSGRILGQGSQHPQFPASDTQVDSPYQFWRTRYGTGSGNGIFGVIAGKRYIYFDEGGSELTGIVDLGVYNGQELAVKIAAAMNAAVGKTLTYACTYSETTAKFTISASGNFTLRWLTGSYPTNDISELCGFDSSADDTGASSYTSDYRRIHYARDYITCDTINAMGVNFFGFLGHNISSAGQINMLGANDQAFTQDYIDLSIPYNAGNIFYFHSSLLSRRYWQASIQDIANPQGFVQIGTIIVGFYWQPERSFGKHKRGKYGRSQVDLSDSGVPFCQKKTIGDLFRFPFSALTEADKAHALALQEEAEIHSGIVVCEDYNNPNTNSYWVLPLDLVELEYKAYDNYGWQLTAREIT